MQNVIHVVGAKCLGHMGKVCSVLPPVDYNSNHCCELCSST